MVLFHEPLLPNKAVLNPIHRRQLCCFLTISNAFVVYVSILISHPVSTRGSTD